MNYIAQERVCGLIAGWSLFFGCLNTSAAGGTVTFANNSSSNVINGQTGNPVTTNDGIHASLYWAPTGSSNFMQLGAAALIGDPLPGLFAGGTRTTGPETSGGSSGQFQVRAAGGVTALLGQSAVIQ